MAFNDNVIDYGQYDRQPFPILPWKKYDLPAIAEVETIEYDKDGRIVKRTIQRQVPALPYQVTYR